MVNQKPAVPSRVPWMPSVRKREENEQAFLEWLTRHGISYAYEDILLAEGGRESGMAPDVRILATPEWGEQFVEYTHARNPTAMRTKVNKIRRTVAAHGVRITLVMGGRHANPPGLEYFHFDEIKDDPGKFKDHLRRLAPARKVA